MANAWSEDLRENDQLLEEFENLNDSLIMIKMHYRNDDWWASESLKKID